MPEDTQAVEAATENQATEATEAPTGQEQTSAEVDGQGGESPKEDPAWLKQRIGRFVEQKHKMQAENERLRQELESLKAQPVEQSAPTGEITPEAIQRMVQEGVEKAQQAQQTQAARQKAAEDWNSKVVKAVQKNPDWEDLSIL